MKISTLKTYVNEYDKLCMFHIPNDSMYLFGEAINDRLYDNVPFEYHIGLFKFICDKFEIDWFSWIKWYRGMSIIPYYETITRIYPKEYLDFMFKEEEE